MLGFAHERELGEIVSSPFMVLVLQVTAYRTGRYTLKTFQIVFKGFQFPFFFFWFSFIFIFCFLGSNPRHMEVPRLGVELELQLLAYTTATAMPDPSPICDLHYGSQQGWILDPLIEARECQPCILLDTSWIFFCCATKGTLVLDFV